MRQAKATKRISTNTMRTWMRAAEPKEREKLAAAAKTTVGQLQQLSGGYRNNGAASAKPELAARLEIASVKLQREGLAPLTRESLCPACNACDLAAAARVLQQDSLV